MKLFGGGKPDHPLAEPKEARRVLDGLPANDPVKALDELMHWMETVAVAEGFKPDARIQLLFTLDEAAQPRVRKLAADYFAAVRPSRFQENRLWTALHGFWKQAGFSYARCIDLYVQNVKGVDAAKSLLPQLLVRTLRSLAQQMKWMHMRYGPVELATWGVFNSVYAFAEMKQLAQAKVTVYPGTPGDSTPQQEYLKASLFDVGAPDGLLPVEVELAERLVAVFASRFSIAAAPAAELNFWTDLAQAMAPARLSRAPKAAIGVRYFGPGNAVQEVHAFAERCMTEGQVPPELNLRGSNDVHMVQDVLRHLHLYWSPQSPERKTQRHPVKSRLSVSFGYENVSKVLGGGDSLDFDNQSSESWIVENVSAGGFGAIVPQVKGDWLRVGVLLALQPEGGNNWVLGIVRRVNKTAGQQARVGIETLSKTPALLLFGVSGVRGVAEHGILIRTADAAEARIVLKPGVFAPAQNLEMTRGERHHIYIPQAVAERGEDYEIARFREMVRET